MIPYYHVYFIEKVVYTNLNIFIKWKLNIRLTYFVSLHFEDSSYITKMRKVSTCPNFKCSISNEIIIFRINFIYSYHSSCVNHVAEIWKKIIHLELEILLIPLPAMYLYQALLLFSCLQ